MSRIGVVVLLLVPLFAGCIDPFGWFPPDAQVQVTPVERGRDAWNTDSHFTVRAMASEPFSVRILAVSAQHRVDETVPADDAVLEEGQWVTENSVDLADGTWTIKFYVDGFRWDTFREVQIDTTRPTIQGLELIGTAANGAYTIGQGATVDADGMVEVSSQATGVVIAQGLPATVTGLGDGVFAYDVSVKDPAGNQRIYTVQVRSGDVDSLPEGRWTAGIVARYTNQLRIWNLTAASEYLDRPAALAAHPEFLQSGYQITPDDPEIKEIVNARVDPSMNTIQAAMALYEWLYDAMEYDDARLDSTDLLSPTETIQAGGGVCRDLAALYVSLLRAADVPARVVTGYLAGDVNGFHAWVEFYAGSVQGQEPWIPVDVSGIDGSYSLDGLLFAFAIQRPDYLSLRDLPASAEVDGWSTVLSVRSEYTGPPPTLEFETVLSEGATVMRTLCIDRETFRRTTVDTSLSCPPGYSYFEDPIPARTVDQVIDYGISASGQSGTVTMVAAYPFAADAAPDQVTYVVYGPGNLQRDAQTGKITKTFPL